MQNIIQSQKDAKLLLVFACFELLQKLLKDPISLVRVLLQILVQLD